MKTVRSDLCNAISCESGTLVIIPIEKIESMFGIHEEERIEFMKSVLDHGGDVLSIDPFSILEIRKRFSLNSDGTNNTIIQICPNLEEKDFVRLLEKEEPTLHEYFLLRKKELNIKIEDIIGSISDLKEEYIKKMGIYD
jgi:hypothetical protein